MDIRAFIGKLNISTDKKLKLYKQLRRFGWRLKYSKHDYAALCNSQTFVPSCGFYGHEHWLKSYCGYNDSIFSLIEHGVYFGEYTGKAGWSVEWDLGSILTFGEYRQALLKSIYPDYSIFKIGPRVLYAPVDMEYYNELKSQLDPSSKTIALYPAHSLESVEARYDEDLFVKEALELAKELKIKNILVSLHPADIKKNASLKYKEYNFVMVTGGSNEIRFLPRLKAIMTLADLTYSNTLGTHIGYSVALGKPHILNTTSDQSGNINDFDDATYKNFNKEQEELSKIFNGNNPLIITKEQIEACDYYWGLHDFKSKEDLFQILESCKKQYTQFYKNRTIK